MNEVEMDTDRESRWNSSNNTTADNSEANSEAEEEDASEVASNTNINSSPRKRRDSVALRREKNSNIRSEVNMDHVTQMLMETRNAIVKLRDEAAEAGHAIQQEFEHEETRITNETPADQEIKITPVTPITVTFGFLRTSQNVFSNICTTFDEKGELNPEADSSKVIVLAEGETEEDHHFEKNYFDP